MLLSFPLTPGQASDISNAQGLLKQVRIRGRQGRPGKRCHWLLEDKGYDAEQLRQYCGCYRMQPNSAPNHETKPELGLPRLFDRPKCRQRNIIERLVGWLKQSRRICTRYDKLARRTAAKITLACTLRCLRRYFSYRAWIFALNASSHHALRERRSRSAWQRVCA